MDPADELTVIAGGGAIGICLAVSLARLGHPVAVCDPAPLADNASGVAAGMLAPAMEAVLDPMSTAQFPLLLAARDLWPDFAAGLGLPLDRCGAVIAGAPDFVECIRGRLSDLDAPAQTLDAADVHSLTPGAGAAVFSPDDWRLDPVLALATLKAAAQGAGVRVFAQAVTGFEPGRVKLSGGGGLAASRLIIAAGLSADLAILAPELAALSPIKGQILHVPHGPRPPCILRGEQVYICPAARGALIGATMEAGRGDRRVDPEQLDTLRRRAAELNPAYAAAPGEGRAGVRAATPDGLPLVGASRRPGIWIAAGARRNGWLLAPLIARTLVAALKGEDAAFSQQMSAQRFLPPAAPGSPAS